MQVRLPCSPLSSPWIDFEARSYGMFSRLQSATPHWQVEGTSSGFWLRLRNRDARGKMRRPERGGIAASATSCSSCSRSFTWITVSSGLVVWLISGWVEHTVWRFRLNSARSKLSSKDSRHFGHLNRIGSMQKRLLPTKTATLFAMPLSTLHFSSRRGKFAYMNWAARTYFLIRSLSKDHESHRNNHYLITGLLVIGGWAVNLMCSANFVLNWNWTVWTIWLTHRQIIVLNWRQFESTLNTFGCCIHFFLYGLKSFWQNWNVTKHKNCPLRSFFMYPYLSTYFSDNFAPPPSMS